MKKYLIHFACALLSLLVSTSLLAQGFSGASVSPAAQTVCSGGIATLTVTGTSTCTATPAWSATYQWYSSSDCAIWTPIPAATGVISASAPSAVYTPTVPATGGASIALCYRVEISSILSPCIGVGPTFTTGSSMVSVIPGPPGAITGTLAICDGTTTTLSSTGGGAWMSSSAITAPIGSASGVAVGVSSGTTTITNTNACGSATAVLTVNPYPSAITGTATTCVGSTRTLSSSTPGGMWSSSDVAIASVTPLGIVTGVSEGTTDITYTLSTGCMTTRFVTVYPVPAPITGITSVCEGGTTSLSNATPGGIWSSSSPSIAIAGLTTGVVTGNVVGTATISYTLSAGCVATTIVTVGAGTSISGASTVCIGQSTTWTHPTPGGTWSSSNPAIAMVNSSGVIMANLAGVTTISYAYGGCIATKAITVNPLPAAITGTPAVCAGSAISLSSSSGGGIWTSAVSSVATVNPTTGLITGVAFGTSVITYMVSTGCYRTIVLTVNPLPGPVLGSAQVCVLGTTTLSATPAGGTWQSGATGMATVSSSGVVSAYAVGTVPITYVLPTGCSSVAIVTVNNLPPTISPSSLCVGASAFATAGVVMTSSAPSVVIGGAGIVVTGVSAGTASITYTSASGCMSTSVMTVNATPPIVGVLSLCVGSVTSLTISGSDGTWSASTGVASVDASGVVSGLSPGTSAISYTSSAGCVSSAIVTVNPPAASISGTLSVCVGSTTTLAATGSGTWSATAGSGSVGVGVTSGIATGLSAGTAAVTYTAPTGCFSTAIVTVNATAPITGAPSLCAGLSTTLINATMGGTWTSSNDMVATVGSSTGVVNGVTGGAVTITYSGIGCGAVTTTLSVVASTAPITGTLAVCEGHTATLSSATAGGIWSSSNASIVSVMPSTGVVTGWTPGIATITYSAGSCGVVVADVTVNPNPAPISGTPLVCVGTSATLAATGVGTWTATPSSIISTTILPGGCVVTGSAPGTATITYTILATGCFVTIIGSVNALPSGITGSLSICQGSSTSLSSATGGGSWSSGSSLNASVTSSGVVTGLLPGTAVITYTVPSGCSVTAVVTVNAQPAAITGSLFVCSLTSSILSNTTPGGNWISGNLTIAEINSAGVVFGNSVGTATISYTLPSTGCLATAIVTCYPSPPAITGPDAICEFGTTTLSCSIGGTWTSSDTSVAFITPGTGVVSGVAPGTTTIMYQMSSGCFSTRIETVNPSPATIGGALWLCSGFTTTLSDVTPGGSWSSGSSVASINTSGVVTGLTPGTSTITYSLPSSGCFTTAAVTVNPAIGAIGGSSSVCIGGSATLSSGYAGGTWTSSSYAVADVGASSGIVTGVALGSAVITYTAPSGCQGIKTVNVIPSISPITGIFTVCPGAVTTLSSATSGGTWSSGAIPIASVGTSGIVTGVAMGTAAITYSVSSCGTVYATVTVLAQPAVFTVSSGGNYCSGLPGIAVTLSGSQPGVIYNTYYSTALAGPPVTGTGSAITLGTFATGTYSVTATSSLGCTKGMTGSAVINALAIPTAYTVTGGGSWCLGSPGVPVKLSFSSIGVNYQVYNGATAMGGPVAGTGDTLTLGTFTVAGTYSVVATKVSTGCVRNMSGFVVITIVPGCTGTPVAGTASASSYRVCVGNYVYLMLSGASAGCGVTYQWQYSTDSVTWANLLGATTITPMFTVPETRYYRCKVTCLGSGLVSYSNAVRIIATYLFTSAYGSAPDTACGAARFNFTSCVGTSMSLSAVTYFGDGSSGTTSLTSYVGFAYGTVYHMYALPGTYTIKHVLYYGGVATDSIIYSYEYRFCRRLSVKFYKDNNTNCSFDGGDIYNTIPVTTEIDSNGIPVDTITGTSGFYYGAYGPVGTVYRFRVLSVSGGLTTACPSSGIMYDTISATTAYPINYFGLQCATPDFDIIQEVTTASMPMGQNSYIWLSNPHCTAVSPVVTMHFSPRYTFGYSYPSPTYVSGNTAVWNFSSVSAATSGTPYIYVHLNAPIVIVPGDTVHNDFLATPLSGDMNTGNNYVMQINTVTGSYDPNEIAVAPAGFILPCSELTYTVDFENMGNDTAHNIYVLDTLSGDLDPQSMAITYASHVMNISMINDGGYKIAKFDFPDIDLLDSSYHNLCHGKFIYTIKARSGMSIGTSIPNRAGIYFDNNPVVLTNTVSNAIGIAAVSGPSLLCTGFSGTFNDATVGGTWHTSDPLVASVTTPGTIAAHRVGTSVVSYTASNSCGSLTATKVVNIDSSYVPVVSLAAYPGNYIISGQADTLVASVAGAGPTPTYRWLLNGVVQPGVTGPSFARSSFADGDSVVCEVMGTGACGLPSYNFVIMHVSSGASSVVQKEGIVMYPNPTAGIFTLAGAIDGENVQVEIRNMLGQLVHTESVPVSNGRINKQMQLDRSLANGMYTVILHTGSEKKVLHFVLQQ